LEPTDDILASLTATKGEGQTVVAFAAEAGDDVDRARAKLTRKNADLIVLNDISNPAIGFESQENAVTLIDSASDTTVPQASKDTIADAILERVDQLRNKQAQPKA
jgi:phosphopantothenoylcysteine decarboxylase/phosphopantothenate--cysteine ligase